jgi:hypothetical protein
MQPGQSSGYVKGNITTQNLVPAGAATANSAVELDLGGGYQILGIQVTGTYTGALSVQFSIDGTTWVTVGGTVVNNSIEDVTVGTALATIVSAAQGIRRIRCAGMGKVRVTALAAVTGTAAISLIATS